MCGIAGIVVKPGLTLPNLRERLNAMAQQMHHRGPDDSGIFIDANEHAGLVNTRLAIRDLSSAGHMPMRNADETLHITFNGEIYNADELRAELEQLGYAFRSRSDTEVILHGYAAWGKKVAQHLRGMFAFGILDLRQPGRLYLARDQLGIKPLYYARRGDGFVFASELKALLASGLIRREISPGGLTGYLLMGSVPNPLTIYYDAIALEPASCLTIQFDQSPYVEPELYWHLPSEIIEPNNLDDVVAQVRDRLAEAVRRQLVSDVPLGAFLSGGLDSTAVVALMRQATTGTIRTCSMIFEEAEYSEAQYARAVAQAVGAEHFERVITADDVVREIDRVMSAMDQPTVDGVNTFFVSQTARQAGLTVALSGLGGDELFGGYPSTFQGMWQMARALKWSQSVPGGAMFACTVMQWLPNHRRWSRIQDALSRPASFASAYLARRGLFSLSEVKLLLKPDLWQAGVGNFDPIEHIEQAVNENRKANAGKQDSFSWVSRAELRTYTHHQLLRDTDVMSMAHSLEVRVPLLDVCLVELVLRIPAAIKQDRSPFTKPLLRKSLGDLIPDVVRHRQGKQGFTFPLDRWMRGAMQTRMAETLEVVQARGWLQPTAVRDTWREFQAGNIHWSRLWALVALASIK